MADEPKIPKEVEFFFEFDPSYRIVAANGVWGGLTPRGELQLDFFVERQAIPESVTNAVIDDGRLGKEIGRKPQKRITRRLQVGVLLSPNEARSLVDFLNLRLSELEKVRKQLDATNINKS